MRVNGISFDGLHSYHDFGMWLSERPDWGDPEPKLNLVEIPGADGLLDLTEANAGEVKFHNRTITLTFAAMVKADKQESFKARIRNALHGKVCTIIPDEAPDWYYHGRCTVSFIDQASWKLRIIVTVDADPYAMKTEQTTIDLHADAQRENMNVYRAEDIQQNPVSTYSDFRFGTIEFPDGIQYPNDNLPGTAHYYDLTISWGAGVRVGTGMVNVFDSTGAVFSKNISSSITAEDGVTTQAGSATLTISEIAAGHVDPEKVWKITVGIYGCEIYTAKRVYVYKVWNERKTVVPVFAFLGVPAVLSGLTITKNGKDFTLTEGVYQIEDFVLTQGWNEILVTVLEDGQLWRTMTLNMFFREGRL